MLLDVANCTLYSPYCRGEGIEGFMGGADSAAMMISLSWGSAFQLIREFEVLKVASGCWFWMFWRCSCVIHYSVVFQCPRDFLTLSHLSPRVIWRPSASGIQHILLALLLGPLAGAS